MRLARVHSHLELAVSHTGGGIAPQFLPNVFDRFRQADSTTTRTHGGLGLGLAIVRHLTELHGGTVRAESAGEGQGAKFLVKLPLMAVKAGARAPGQPRQREDAEGSYAVHPKLEGVRVLVVDDEADTRLIISTVLSQYGAEIKESDTAAAALEVLAGWNPNVLVSDIGMPGEDGYDLIRNVRALPEECGGRTPAAALTAYARDEGRRGPDSHTCLSHSPRTRGTRTVAAFWQRVTRRT